MKVAVFNTRSFDRKALAEANATQGHELVFFESELTAQTTALAAGFPAVCVKTPSRLDEPALVALAQGGTRWIALRSAGFDYVDVAAAHRLGLVLVRVPAYSPYAIAEHTVGLMLAVNRKIHRAYTRVREGNLSLDGLVGFDVHGKTVGIIGTGHIGSEALAEATRRMLPRTTRVAARSTRFPLSGHTRSSNVACATAFCIAISQLKSLFIGFAS